MARGSPRTVLDLPDGRPTRQHSGAVRRRSTRQHHEDWRPVIKNRRGFSRMGSCFCEMGPHFVDPERRERSSEPASSGCRVASRRSRITSRRSRRRPCLPAFASRFPTSRIEEGTAGSVDAKRGRHSGRRGISDVVRLVDGMSRGNREAARHLQEVRGHHVEAQRLLQLRGSRTRPLPAGRLHRSGDSTAGRRCGGGLS